MGKVAFFSLGAFGHVVPSLPLVRALVAAGCEVLYHSGARHHEAVTEAGARFRAYPEAVDVIGVTSKPRSAAFHGYAMARSVHVMLGEPLRALRAEGVDAVVHDCVAPWGRAIARALGVPAVAFAPLFVHNEATEQWMSEVRAPAVPVDEDRRATNRHYALRTMRLLGEVNARLRGLGVDPIAVRDYARCYEPVTIVCTSRLFQPEGDSFDEGFVFTGPLMDDDPRAGFPDAAAAPGDPPLVYVSLGTTNFNRDLSLHRVLMRALGALDARVVMTLGGGLDPDALGAVPGHVTLRRFIPEAEEAALMRRATAVINHAGFSTLHKCLYYGVPMVAIPLLVEHARAARRLADLGAGIALDRETVTAPVLGAAVRQVLLDAGLRSNARHVGRSFREAGGTARALRAVLECLPQRAGAPASGVARAHGG